MSENTHSPRLDMTTPDGVARNLEALAALFPNCITETAIEKNGVTELRRSVDFDLLKQELSHQVIDGPKERYRLEWPGKREAIVTANLPTTKTLRPVREDSVDFDNTENLYIEGDNLEVLKLLQESYFGKINVIYIDPPYNKGRDFIYKDYFVQDNYAYKAENGLIDEQNRRLIQNLDTSGRFHSDWLTMMYPRLKLARNLLADDGIIAVSIDDSELFQLGKLLDEIFGSSNKLACSPWLSEASGGKEKTGLRTGHEYLLIYFKKSADSITKEERSAGDLNLKDKVGPYRKGRELMKWGGTSLREDRPNQFYQLPVPNGEMALPYRNDGKEGHWRWGKLNMDIIYAMRDPSFFHWEKRPFDDGVVVNGMRERWVPYEKIRDSKKASGWSTWLDKFGSNADATRDLKELFGLKIFDTPKPIQLIRWIISLHESENSIVLDFFSGSAASAHATMQLNHEDGGKRSFIMVQVPEVAGESSDAYKAGYKNICEIGKERIRRARKNILRNLNHNSTRDSGSLNLFSEQERVEIEPKSNLDLGFRVYRLDESNMQDVYYRPQEYQQDQLEVFTDNIKPDRTADDLLAQVMLDWGLPLSYKIEQLEINGKKVFKVAESSLLACFDTGIDEEFARKIAAHEPLRVVFRDKSFKDDTAKENVRQLLKQLSPDTEMRVI